MSLIHTEKLASAEVQFVSKRMCEQCGLRRPTIGSLRCMLCNRFS